MRFCGIWLIMRREHCMIYSVRLIYTTAFSLGSACMLFTKLEWLLSLPGVTACASQSTACGIERRRGAWIGVNCIFQEWHHNTKQYTFHWLLCIPIVWGRVPVTGMQARMNLSKPGMNLSKPEMDLSKPGKTQQSCYNVHQHYCYRTCIVMFALLRNVCMCSIKTYLWDMYLAK